MAKTNLFLTKNQLNFLKSYMNNASPTGFEKEGQKLWLKLYQTIH
jgi:hypothetical protein